MSLTRCHQCDEIWDTDEFPEGYYDKDGNARDHYLCENCSEEREHDHAML
jgi:hypothetical protein